LAEIRIAEPKGYCYNSQSFWQWLESYGAEHARLVSMNRREFLKRIATAVVLLSLGFSADESPAFLRPSAGVTAGASAERMVLGGNLFTAYTRGGSSVNGPVQKLRLSQTRFSVGWKTANNPDFLQLL
jgi:hypothetical protein